MSPPLLAYYGDDFTGSADVMEVLQWSGLRTVLFLQPPTKEQLDKFENLCAFGVAGWSRTMSPREMDDHLRPALIAIRDSGARLVHYKTCSTFDSSPQIGSIGKAIEIGRQIFGDAVVPIVIGAPNLGRYQVFGNLFARSGLDTEPFRLDRHPTMSQHPITPMDESDLRVHLGVQTSLEIDLIDVLQLQQPVSPSSLASVRGQAVLFDVLEQDHLPRIGQCLASFVDESSPRFMIGSSGIEYALTAHWENAGQLETLRSHSASKPTFDGTDQLLAITGSCSPVNDRQIAAAIEVGFEPIALATARLVDPQTADHEIASVVQRAVECLQRRANVMIHSSRGPTDPRVDETTAALKNLGFDARDIKLHSGRTLGPKLGQILKTILQQHPLRRVGVAGGDTSGYVAEHLKLTALEAVAPVAPGSPLCRATSENEFDGVEFFFKGGQVGKDDVWSTMLHGTSTLHGTS